VVHQPDPQDETFALLSDPATYGGAEVTRIDTHAASVFLAGERAYKVKRAVRFPFLDYSTLAKRKTACEAELAVNGPFAPQIYLRVVPIARTDAGLALGGAGEPVEWAVEMLRFDENATLDRLAEDGKIDLALADRLARVVAAAHAKAPAVDAAPWIEALGLFIEQNDAAFRETPELFPSSDAMTLIAASRAALKRVRPLLGERGAQGLIRRGHGDLHLGNIALIAGEPVPFDAIEFDPLIASGDVLYDLAFLLMDLVERGLKQAANVVLNRYLTKTRRDSDLDALAALPLFMWLRAAIRAKVTAARLENAKPAECDAIAKSAQTYFRLACELIAPPRPKLIAVGGLSGTGKSVLARALAADIPPMPGAVVIRSDVERKMLFGVAETNRRLPSEAYSIEATAQVYASLCAKAQRIISAGHSAIGDAVFARESERGLIEQVASSHGLAFRALFLTADLATRITRVGGRTGDASDADASIARQQETYDLGTLTWVQVDASGTPDETLRHARAALAR
jgi:aminoglycoside phosphotransferase family enzyme/predicted kinase